ncbi:unnamed protein product, partial [Medioppia subpectinata]
DGCPISPGFTLSKVYYLKPLLANNKDKRGLALDGQLKHEDTNLASSTIVTDPTQKENLGIIVQYKVKVKLCLGPLGGDVVAELPFVLMHPKPDDNNLSTPSKPMDSTNADGEVSALDGQNQAVTEANLIQLDTVFKKSSPNGKITVYLGKRDFVDHLTHVDPIDGVVLIDPDYLKDRKVFGHVLAAFRYGREDLDVLGLTFRKDLYLASEQIFPLKEETNSAKRPLTRLQERLIKKLGSNAFPFFFELPPHCPASVTLQPAPGDTGKPCGVDYELKAYVAENVDEKPHKRNSVRLAIRKVVYAPSKQGDQPSVEVSKEFMMSPNKLHLEASLDKELYHHGENIAVNVHIANSSNRTVKKVKVSVRQFADICLFSTAQYKCSVAEIENESVV